MRERFLVRDTACPTCPIGCTKVTGVSWRTFAGVEKEGPEYETIYALGTNLENDSFEAIISADMLCDQRGLDTISTEVTIGFVMECFEEGKQYDVPRSFSR